MRIRAGSPAHCPVHALTIGMRSACVRSLRLQECALVHAPCSCCLCVARSRPPWVVHTLTDYLHTYLPAWMRGHCLFLFLRVFCCKPLEARALPYPMPFTLCACASASGAAELCLIGGWVCACARHAAGMLVVQVPAPVPACGRASTSSSSCVHTGLAWLAHCR